MNGGKLKTPENAMRTLALSPHSSVRSTTTVETRDASYFPGCRKDTNCKCDICVESMNAVLDSLRRSSRVKISSSRPKVPRSPVPFTSDDSSTTPPQNSNDPVEIERNPSCSQSVIRCSRSKFEFFSGGVLLKLVIVLLLVSGVEYGVFWAKLNRRALSRDLVKKLGERSVEIEGLNGKLTFVKNELERFMGKSIVSNCSSVGSSWKINQENSLLNTRCVLHRSIFEEISIWGWPLQTSGLISSGFSSRSFTILSGKLTEWSKKETGFFSRRANDSWVLEKWGSSIVHLDPGTWILEHKPGFLAADNNAGGLITAAAVEFLNFRLSRGLEKMKHEFWLPSFFFDTHFGGGENVQTPT